MIDKIGDNIIDTRDLQEEIERIEREIESEQRDETELDKLRADLAMLTEAKDEIEDCSIDRFEDGVTLVCDRYFETYARETAEELFIERDASWPHTCIDWERAARELKIDYNDIKIQGEIYWYR